MESLTDQQQVSLQKMSTDRIQGRLMRAGLDEDEVYAMDRTQLLEAMARVMLGTGGNAPGPQTEIQLQFEIMRMQLEQCDREHKREMELQREMHDGELRMQMERDLRAREETVSYTHLTLPTNREV